MAGAREGSGWKPREYDSERFILVAVIEAAGYVEVY
jgi:hypothetical protein